PQMSVRHQILNAEMYRPIHKMRMRKDAQASTGQRHQPCAPERHSAHARQVTDVRMRTMQTYDLPDQEQSATD
ncbi:Hypothetical predicted protein, partial [Pelobates cultripes]